MGFFAIAHQLRNIVALGPSLLTEGSLAVMAGRDGKVANTPDNVMALCTYASTFVSLLLAGFGIILLPWGLPALYGHSYAPAAAATALALTTAVIHMGSAPAAARLSIVSIKTTGVVNTAWAIFVAVAATTVLLNHGDAAKGAAVYLAGHLFVAALQFYSLGNRTSIPAGTLRAFGFGVLGSLTLAALAYWRQMNPGLTLALTLLMTVALLATGGALALIGRRHGWMPTLSAMGAMARSLRNKLPGSR
jgi:hypothetical protein